MVGPRRLVPRHGSGAGESTGDLLAALKDDRWAHSLAVGRKAADAAAIAPALPADVTVAACCATSAMGTWRLAIQVLSCLCLRGTDCTGWGVYGRRMQPPCRVETGYDIHQLVEGYALVIGVEGPVCRGLHHPFRRRRA